MPVQIGDKTQIAQWTVLDGDAENNHILISETIDGIEWVFTLTHIFSPNIEDYNVTITTQVEQQKVIADFQLYGKSDFPQEIWALDGYQVCQLRKAEDILITYYAGFYGRNLSHNNWPGSCLYHFFLYKKTKTLPPVNR